MSLVLQNFRSKEVPVFKMEVRAPYFLGKKVPEITAANRSPDFSYLSPDFRDQSE